MTKDLTVGKPFSVLLRFCTPLFVSVIFQQMYNIADSLIAGRYIGENALAAVGNSYEITLIFLAVGVGCNIGCSVVAARLFGSKNYRSLHTAVTTSLISGAAICALMMSIGFLFNDSLLRLINTPSSVFADSKNYLNIYILCVPFIFNYNIATGIFSALGDSKTPFWFLSISSIANIAADIIFVKYFNLGVAGLALATLACQAISCILSLAFLFKKIKSYKVKDKPLLFSKQILFEISKIAIPSIFQQSFISIGNIILQGIINSFDTAVMAGYSAGVKLNNLVITSYTTIGNGISSYTAQNLGANKPKRIREGFNSGVRLILLLSIPIVLIYLLHSRQLVEFFIENPTKAAIDTGVVFLRILSPFYFIISIKLISDGILRGMGQMKSFMVATFSDLILRVALAFILSKTFLGSNGIWAAWPIGWCIGTLMSVCFYNLAKQKILNKRELMK